MLPSCIKASVMCHQDKILGHIDIAFVNAQMFTNVNM